MDNKELFVIFRNHTHTGAYPDAKRLPPWALGFESTTGYGLISPGNKLFTIGVDNDGSITTTPYPYSVLVTAPGGATFAIGVASDGALTTTPAKTSFKNINFARSFPLVDALGVPWNLVVDDDGVIGAQPA